MSGEKRIRNVKEKGDAAGRIKGMPAQEPSKKAVEPPETESRDAVYGDLTSLNTSRLILDSVGASLLSDIVGDIMGLSIPLCGYEKRRLRLGISLRLVPVHG